MAVVAGDVVLMRLRQADLFFAGQFMIEDVRFHPRSPARIRILNPCWLGIVPHTTPQRVRVLDEETHRGLRLRLEPESPRSVHVDDIYEFLPDPESGGWMIDHDCRLTFRRATPAHELGLHVMLDPKGVPTMHWEFDYHIPTYGAGQRSHLPIAARNTASDERCATERENGIGLETRRCRQLEAGHSGPIADPRHT